MIRRSKNWHGTRNVLCIQVPLLFIGLTVSGLALEILPTSLSNGVEMVEYAHTMSARRGTPPYTWKAIPMVYAWGSDRYGKTNVPKGLRDVRSVSAGHDHSLALLRDGTVRAWGVRRVVPPDIVNAVLAVAGGEHNMALLQDGTVRCWGSNLHGQCNVPAGLQNVVDLDAGFQHSVALTSDGDVIVWGNNLQGQREVPPDLSNVVAIAAGTHHNVAAMSDGTVMAWGRNDYGQARVPAELSDVVDVAAGLWHSLALLSDGTVTAWGRNFEGQTDVPPGLADVVAISAGGANSAALTRNGRLYLWGLNVAGSRAKRVPDELSRVVAIDLGNGHILALRADYAQMPEGLAISNDGLITGIPTQAGTNRVTFVVQDAAGESAHREIRWVIEPNENTRPVISSFDPPVGEVVMDENESETFRVFAEDPEGSNLVYRWTWDGENVGTNSSVYTHTAAWGSVGIHELRCEISDGLWTNLVHVRWHVKVIDVPIQISSASLPAGTVLEPYSHSLSATNGVIPYAWDVPPQIVAWGESEGSPPTDVTNVIAVAAGNLHGLALLADGTVEAWGSNVHGQRRVPEGLSDVIAIDAGSKFSVAVRSDGTVTAWGHNGFGETLIPEGLTNVTAVSCGAGHTLVLKSDSTVEAWGRDVHDQLTVPLGLTGVVSIAAGGFHNLALKSDGTVEAWGYNEYGQTSVPAGLSNVTAVAGGRFHSLAISADGTVLVWGQHIIAEGTAPKVLREATAIAGGETFSLALKPDGTVTSWGPTYCDAKDVPPLLYDVASISAGDCHSLTLRSIESQLPSGLVLSGDGTISGIPMYEETNRTRFFAEDAQGAITSKVLSIIVNPNPNLRPVKIFSAPRAESIRLDEGSSRVFFAWGYDPEGSNLVYSWSWDTENVGENSKWYSLSGDRENLGVHRLRCSVSDGLWTNFTLAEWDVTVVDLPLEITTQSLPNGVELEPYLAGLHADYGVPPYTFVVTQGELPEDLVLSGDGVISGTTTNAGTNLVTFTVQDALEESTSKTILIVIDPNPNRRPVKWFSYPTAGTVSIDEGSSQLFLVWAYDPEGRYLTHRWTVDGVEVGAGLNWFLYSAGPEDFGVHQLQCDVSDNLWDNIILSQWDITVNDLPLEITSSAMPVGMEMSPYGFSLEAANGTPPYTWSVMPEVVAWGINAHGQITLPEGLSGVKDLAAGGLHSLALRSDRTVLAWGPKAGRSDFGQSTVPPGLSNVEAIAAGFYHSLALKSDGTIEAWGDDYFGQSKVPIDLTNVVAIAGGGRHSLALKSDGSVKAWGWDNYGQSAVPPGLSNVVAISGGGDHSLALKSDGSVMAWGKDNYGQCAVPPGLSNVMAIAGGADHSLALKSDGSVMAWGRDNYGQSAVPPGLSNVVAIAAGSAFSLAVVMDGTVTGWGRNNYDESTPPPGLKHAILVAAGASHSLALQADFTQLPDGLEFTPEGLISGTPTMAQTSLVTFVVRDSLGETTNKTLQVEIESNPNERPIITTSAPPVGTFTMDAGTTQTFVVWAHDPEGGDITHHWAWNGMQAAGISNTYTFAADWGDAGQYQLRCDVSDGLWSNVVDSRWNVIVSNDNDKDGMSNERELDLGRDPNDPGDGGDPSSIEGTITGAGVSFPGAYVDLRGESGASYFSTTTDSNGSYGFSAVFPGDYFVKVGADWFADEWYEDATHRTYAVSKTVPADSAISGFDFDLSPGQSPALVEVTSAPTGSVVYLDLQPAMSVTPCILDVGEVGTLDWAGLPLAPRTVTVRKSGRPQSPPREIAAVEAETITIHFDLASDDAGQILASTTPEGAEVFIDTADNLVGTSPVIVSNLAPGAHLILIRAPGMLRPRPVEGWVSNQASTVVSISLNSATRSNHLSADLRSIPPGADVYLDYLPTTNFTDLLIDNLDFVSQSGEGWSGLPHTVMLRRPGFQPTAPRYLQDQPSRGQSVVVHLIPDRQSLLDDDRDGLPDLWEDAYRLRELAPSKHGPKDDPDVDGATNEEEMYSGTHPLDGDSRFRLSNLHPQPPGQACNIIFSSVPGRSYVVLSSEDLLSDWEYSSGVIVANDEETVWTCIVPAGEQTKCFRVMVLTP
jgi:alpha-tubulin suppressor-like RCC1 family protein